MDNCEDIKKIICGELTKIKLKFESNDTIGDIVDHLILKITLIGKNINYQNYPKCVCDYPKMFIIGKLAKIKLISNDSKCDKLIDYLIKEVHAYGYEFPRSQECVNYASNCGPCNCASRDLPLEIIKIIFGHIPIKDRTIDFFKINKYYYNFTHIFYDKYYCCYPEKKKCLVELIPNGLKNIKNMCNVENAGIVKYTPNLIRLDFRDNFNEPLSEYDIFPESQRLLCTGNTFDSVICNFTLYKCLKILVFGDSFNRRLNFELFVSLEIIMFGEQFNCGSNRMMVKKNGKWKPLGYKFNHPPPSIVQLNMGGTFKDCSQKWAKCLEFPETLTKLDLGDWFNFPIGSLKLPPNLEELYVGCNFDVPISFPDKLPESLRKISKFSKSTNLDERLNLRGTTIFWQKSENK